MRCAYVFMHYVCTHALRMYACAYALTTYVQTYVCMYIHVHGWVKGGRVVCGVKCGVCGVWGVWGVRMRVRACVCARVCRH